MKSRGEIETEVLNGREFKEYCNVFSFEHFKSEVDGRLLEEQIKAVTEIVKQTKSSGLKVGDALKNIGEILIR